MNQVQVRKGELCFLLKTLGGNEPAEQLKLGGTRPPPARLSGLMELALAFKAQELGLIQAKFRVLYPPAGTGKATV